jgi:hypothetical protein
MRYEALTASTIRASKVSCRRARQVVRAWLRSGAAGDSRGQLGSWACGYVSPTYQPGPAVCDGLSRTGRPLGRIRLTVDVDVE